MLENIETILKNKIDHTNYITSLLDLSLKYSLISDEIYNQIHINLYNLLKVILKKYTGEINSTISINEAKLINNSNLYMIGLYLKSKSISEELNELIKTNLLPLYNVSNKYLISLVNKTKFFYNIIFKNNIIKTDNYFYNITLYEGITSFFHNYNTSYETDNHLINLDYNPYLKINNLYGVEYISKFLEYLNYENIFCSKFDYQKIIKNIKNLPINIFELVFKRVLCSNYIENNTLYLINREDLYITYSNLKTKLNLSSNINNYLDKCIDKIIDDLILSKTNNTLEICLNLINLGKIYYYTSPRLDTASFIKLKEKFDKSSIDFLLQNNISLYDFIDLLENSNLKSSEIFLLFNKLSMLDIMATKNYLTFSNSIIKDELNRYIYTKDRNIQDFINNNYQNMIIKEK